jgi:SAM-dependent methyltransferase
VSFKDHFSGVAAEYAAHRPEYPVELADALAARAPARGLAWEAGCGSGQLSTLLGDRFERVLASDASAEQVAMARLHPRVEYRVARAEDASGLPSGSVDLCVSAQAAHWFDLDAYYAEVRRVARPRCLVAMITYGTPTVDADVASALEALIAAVRPYWPPDRSSVDQMYGDLPFPFVEEPFPALDMTARWPADRLIGYARTWSSTLGLVKAKGAEALTPLEDALREAWGSRLRIVHWPLGARVGRV